MMNQFEFVPISKLARKSSELLENIENEKPMILVKHSRPIGYFIGMHNPNAKIINLDPKENHMLQTERYFELILSDAWKESFAGRYNGIVPAKDNHNIDRLLGLEGSALMSELPGKDHYTLWERDGEPFLFTMQVYDIHMEVLNALREFCLKHGLVYEIQRRSWYLPGVSILIVIRKR